MPHRTVLAGVLAALVLLSAGARADSSPEDRAVADALYAESGQLMRAGKYAEAIPKLEASQKLDPGIGTTLRLGYCYERVGRIASAWSAYNDAEAMARRADDKRAADASKEAKRLDPLLSRLLIDVTPENRGDGAEIKRDGKALDPALWGTAIPVDPGTHTIEAAKPGKQAWKTTIAIEGKPGATTTVHIPALGDAPAAGSADSPRAFWGPQRIAGVAVAGVGVVGLVVGAIFGGRTLAKTSESDGHCSGSPPRCDPTGLALRDDAKGMAKVADVGLAVGGAALIAGTVVFFTAPKADATGPGARRIEVGPSVASGGPGLALRAAW